MHSTLSISTHSQNTHRDRAQWSTSRYTDTRTLLLILIYHLITHSIFSHLSLNPLIIAFSIPISIILPLSPFLPLFVPRFHSFFVFRIYPQRLTKCLLEIANLSLFFNPTLFSPLLFG